MRPKLTNHENFAISQFTRKKFIPIILKRHLLVAQKVPYKSSIDIAPLSLTIDAVNGQLVHWSKDGKLLNGHSSETDQKKFSIFLLKHTY